MAPKSQNRELKARFLREAKARALPIQNGKVAICLPHEAQDLPQFFDSFFSVLDIKKHAEDMTKDESPTQGPVKVTTDRLNAILYGPPGTGKTFATSGFVSAALANCGGNGSELAWVTTHNQVNLCRGSASMAKHEIGWCWAP